MAPFLVISPYAKVNFVDHRLTDQTSIIKFIEDNWGLGRIGNQSFDAGAGSLMNMFDVTTGVGKRAQKLFLDPSTGLHGMSEIDSMFKQSHTSAYFTVKDAD